MSRASVSFDRQAVAPNESIWLHSPAVGLLASTTMRVSGCAWCELEHVSGRGQRAEVEQHHAGSEPSHGPLDLIQFLVDQIGEADRSSDYEHAADLRSRMFRSVGQEGGARLSHLTAAKILARKKHGVRCRARALGSSSTSSSSRST